MFTIFNVPCFQEVCLYFVKCCFFLEQWLSDLKTTDSKPRDEEMTEEAETIKETKRKLKR